MAALADKLNPVFRAFNMITLISFDSDMVNGPDILEWIGCV